MSKMILIDEAKLSSVLEAIEMLVRFESDSWELGSCRIAGRAVSALREALAEQPAQVSALEFVTMTLEKEHLVGRPIIWAQWPNKENT